MNDHAGDGARDQVASATARLLERPGDDAAHAQRARAYAELGLLGDAEADAAAAVRLDPDEVRYRELLAEILSARGLHRDAAAEYGRLADRDPRQPAWARAAAAEHLAGGDPEQGAELARRTLRLDPADAVAQLTLTRSLVALRNAHQALVAAARLADLLPGDPDARLAWADAHALAGLTGPAFAEYAALVHELRSADPRSATAEARARTLYRSAASTSRWVAAFPWLFGLLFRGGRLRLR